MNLIEHVKKHALEHYNENGWDFCVETMDAEELTEILNGRNFDGVAVTTPEDAVRVVGAICKLHDDRRKDIRATAW